ncbi:hypothetical protein SAMN04489724_2598 [Algoriphagus locisalis]|uniref:Uncharacterized protein n=1 Tax=Algoriphagus locisalis TaxID=305507 RepID=A0A1I7BPP0_9BACT|nr:hypothetical protein [Algoriphagus locisalis]SFT89170.1 hypothetical protein SAMN04489724_2598 [Algoriphagus locisalis]
MKTELTIPFEKLIEELIMADMKHNQLIIGLRNVDLHSDDHFLGIYDLITELVGVSKSDGLDRLSEVYFQFMGHGEEYPITHLGEELRPLAKECYQVIVEIAKELKGGKDE